MQIFAIIVDMCCRPPCEVVSWKTAGYILSGIGSGRPPCEVVSWKVDDILAEYSGESRPPCEVVSWKSIWYPCCSRDGPVDLLVRSWVERLCLRKCNGSHRSTSLWGRELKEALRAWQNLKPRSTSLWGRELKAPSSCKHSVWIMSTSLWGRELKDFLSVII